MTTSFPKFKPTSRSFLPGQFATKRFDAINGAGVTRLYGSKPFGAELTMTFMLDDPSLKQLLDCWNNAKGQYDDLSIPSETFSGMSAELRASISADLASLTWRWVERPSVETVRDELSQVSVKLIATLEAI